MPMHPDFVKIRDKFRKRYGEEEGDRFFYAWLNKHKLDDTKPYSVQAQLVRECVNGICEAFQWAAPLIQLLREDDEAKYYKTIALTANISANLNDYRDLVELERASSTLTWRPLNINHDHSFFLPFPEARVEWAAFENDAVEAIIRIPHTLRNIQRMIENGEIMHVSIEGEPRTGTTTDEGRAPQWYNFTALALLEKDKTLPGDPLTTIEPLFIRESMGRSLVESLSMGEQTKEKEKTMTEEKDQEIQGQELEEMNAGTIGQCGQCISFDEQLPTTVKRNKVVADDPGDGYVLTTEGGIAPGVGICRISGKVCRKNDAACYDGRPRDTPTSADNTQRTKEMTEEKKESIEETVLRTEINDLKAQLLLAQQAETQEIARHVETKKELTEAQDKLTRKEKELTIVTLTKQRLATDAPVLREQIGRLKDDNTRYEVQIKGLEADVTLYKSEAKRFEDQLDTVKRQLAEDKEEILKIRATLNDEVAKRSEATARALSADQDAARVMKENVDLNEQLVKVHRELQDGLEARSGSAKNVIKLQTENAALREENKEKTESIRDLKRKLGKRPKTVTVKV